MDGGSVSGTLSILRLRFRYCLESNTVIRDHIAAKSGRLPPPASTTKGVFAMEPDPESIGSALYLVHGPLMEALVDTLPAPFGMLWVDKMKLVFGVFSLSVFLGFRDWLYPACLWLRMCFGGLWIRYVWNM